MFEKIVVVDSTGLNTWGVERLKELGKEVVFYTGIPETDEEIVNRIGDADCSPEWYNFQHSGSGTQIAYSSLIIHRSGGT